MNFKLWMIATSVALLGCDAINDAEMRGKALACKTQEGGSFQLIFNDDGSGNGMPPIGSGRVRYDVFSMTPPNFVAVNYTSRTGNGGFQNWVTDFETANGIKGKITDMPHNSCIDNARGEPHPYRIDITNWGNVPTSPPVIMTGCCDEANAPI